jgi:hypothetical protein
LIRKIFVTGDLGVVDLEFLLACVYVDPTTNKPFDSIGRFVDAAIGSLSFTHGQAPCAVEACVQVPIETSRRVGIAFN